MNRRKGYGPFRPCGVIRRIGGDAHLAKRITTIGLTEGTPFQTIRNDRKMPVLIYLRRVDPVLPRISHRGAVRVCAGRETI